MKLTHPLAALVLVAASACGGAGHAASFTLHNGTRIDVDARGNVTLSKAGKPLITLDGRGPESASFAASATSLFGQWQHERAAEARRVFGNYDGARITEDGIVTVTYLAGDGRRARVTIRPDEENVRLSVAVDGDYDSIALPLRCDPGASFHGWGEQYNATDQRGERFDLFVEEQGVGRNGPTDALTIAGHAHTTYYPMPYFLDARGFGVLFETDYRTLVDVCATDAAVAWIEVEAQQPLEAIVFTGPETTDVIRALGDHVGRPAKPPDWAYDLWIGAQGGRDAVLAEVDALEAADIPFSAIWAQDWTGPRTNAGGGSGVQYRWVADETHYPDLAGMIDELHQRGHRFLAYANPFVMPNLPDHFAEMDEDGLLIRDDGGDTLLHASPAGDASHPDLTHAATRDYVKKHLRAMVDDLGIDGWMADFGEWVPLEASLSDGADPRAYHNRYPEAWHRLSREVMDAARPDGDWAVFTRSGWTGQQSVAQIVWCGDQEATFDEGDGLPTVVPCLLNLGLSGLPFVTHDIAGFSGGPSSKELYLRWVELGAFTPIMRTHEGNEKEANWSWERDADTAEHLRKFALVHAALKEQLVSLADVAAATSLPVVRHLMLEFPDDAGSRTIDDQFMLGVDLLVAPVVTEGATSREVYLPPGSWHHVWTRDVYEGPATITVNAPIGEPPVFANRASHPIFSAIP